MNKRFAILFFSFLTLAFPLCSGPREDLQARLRSVFTQIHDLQTELSGSRRDLREYDLSNSIFLLELEIDKIEERLAFEREYDELERYRLDRASGRATCEPPCLYTLKHTMHYSRSRIFKKSSTEDQHALRLQEKARLREDEMRLSTLKDELIELQERAAAFSTEKEVITKRYPEFVRTIKELCFQANDLQDSLDELDITEGLMKRPESFQEKLDMRLKKQYLPECEKIFVHASNWPDRPPIIYLCEKSYPSSVLSHLITDLQGTIIHVRNATISN